MSKVKFCGIQPDSDLDYINQLAPDYIGMVFAPAEKCELKRFSKSLMEWINHRRIRKYLYWNYSK